MARISAGSAESLVCALARTLSPKLDTDDQEEASSQPASILAFPAQNIASPASRAFVQREESTSYQSSIVSFVSGTFSARVKKEEKDSRSLYIACAYCLAFALYFVSFALKKRS